MRILFSAYACDPQKGSEFRIGWRWPLQAASLGHEAWIITRRDHQTAIDPVLTGLDPNLRLRVIYVSLPSVLTAVGRRLPAYGALSHIWDLLMHTLWQYRAYRRGIDLLAEHQFDCVHHLTYGGLRTVSFMGRLGLPFLIGPIGGGERAPWPLRRGYGLRTWLWDAVRDASTWFVRFDPLLKDMFDRADRIYVKTPETRQAVPRQFRHKTVLQIELGMEPGLYDLPCPMRTHRQGLRLIYVGRFLDLKGLHIGLEAIAELFRTSRSSWLTMVGEGPEERRWRRLAKKLGIADRIDWLGWVPQEHLADIYRRHDVLLFPSLHDSSGNVVLEALSLGLPVVCLEIGGPAVIVNNDCGRLIRAYGRSFEDVVDDLTRTLREIAENPIELARLSAGARRRSLDFTWEKVVGAVYGRHQPSRPNGAARARGGGIEAGRPLR